LERTGLAPQPALAPARLKLARAWETTTVSETVFGRLLGLYVLLTIVASALGVGRGPAAQTFLLIFTSIVIEALPFILVGALASAAIAVYLPQGSFGWISRLPLALQVPGAALGGFAFPVCECGTVPVGRRLIARGVEPGAAIAFMLAAPVLNPIVLASTWVAYGGHMRAAEMVAGRASLGLVTAAAVGFAFSRAKPGELLRPRPADLEHDHHHDHDHGDAGAGRPVAFATHLVSDFLFMGKFIVLGAGLSALVQVALPGSVVSALGGAPVLSSLALMAVAFVLSLCSEADAFIAASFGSFTPGAQLAFLVFGPLADMKLTVLYGATFRSWFVGRLLLVTIPIVLVGSLIFEVLVR
jgi:uncharacterized membrane protein YraQ (UPF0718 family)